MCLESLQHEIELLMLQLQVLQPIADKVLRSVDAKKANSLLRLWIQHALPLPVV